MKATEQYFLVVLFIKLCKMILSFEPVYKSLNETIQMKSTKLYKVVLTFEGFPFVLTSVFILFRYFARVIIGLNVAEISNFV